MEKPVVAPIGRGLLRETGQWVRRNVEKTYREGCTPCASRGTMGGQGSTGQDVLLVVDYKVGLCTFLCVMRATVEHLRLFLTRNPRLILGEP
jgi:hypothetical protein